MLSVEIGNVTSRFYGIPNEEVHIALAKVLSYQLKGFSVSSELKLLYNAATSSTYTGLVPAALNKLKAIGYQCKVIDKRVQPKPNSNIKIVPEYTARDYQETIINNASSREIIQAATGAGKTFIMALLMEKWQTVPIVIVAPKVSLAEQLKEEIEKFFNISVGIVGDGKRIIKDITVGTPQSLMNDPILTKCKAIFFDEAHNIPSQTIFDVACKATNAYYRIGVSATPWRDAGDDLLIEAVLNIRKPHLNINASKLIAKGKLVPCTINFIQMKSDVDWLGNYADTYNAAIIDNELRNKKIINLTKESLKTRNAVLILISKIRHGNMLLAGLKKSIGYQERDYYEDGKCYTIGNIEFVSGEDDTDRRRIVFQAVKEGFCKVMIGSTIADEGLDIPILDTLILAGAGKSSTRAFQRVGRVLRLHALKHDAVVYDFMDSNETFEKQAQVRYALYSTEPLWKINVA